MGRFGGGSNSPATNHAAAPGHDLWLTHFSHPHQLGLAPPDPLQSPPICAGCNSCVSGNAYYFCRPCNYALDITCAKMARRIRHPAHKDSMNIAVGVAASSCRACGRSGGGFVFRCDPCGYQVHCQCAAKQLTAKHQAHSHELRLVFSPPYDEKAFSCDLCCGTGTDHWLYRCDACDFDSHIECATFASKPAENLQREQKAPQGSRGRRPSHSGDGSDSSSESSGDQDAEDGAARKTLPLLRGQLGQRDRRRLQQGSQQPSAPPSPAPLPAATVRPQRAPSPTMGLLNPLRPLGQSLPPQTQWQPQRPQAPPSTNGLLRPPRPLGQSFPLQPLWQQQQPQKPSPINWLLNPPQRVQPPQQGQLPNTAPDQQQDRENKNDPNATGDSAAKDDCACGDRKNCICPDENRDEGNGGGNCACGDSYNCTCKDANGGCDDGLNSIPNREGDVDDGPVHHEYFCDHEDADAMPNQDRSVDDESSHYVENLEEDYSYNYQEADGSTMTVEYSCEDYYVEDTSYCY
ncbi:hypothetical protein ZIOFF_039878 [Zingiber officinale]|uniref:DC1 domain-containing protein n=1 Tax=Zingiber officinale TaxID=94328 RepID=A0A8J5KXI9_ZINOF|nr:hypothetical protein ZIOFF_039878 [Zingiber officinale]